MNEEKKFKTSEKNFCSHAEEGVFSIKKLTQLLTQYY